MVSIRDSSWIEKTLLVGKFNQFNKVQKVKMGSNHSPHFSFILMDTCGTFVCSHIYNGRTTLSELPKRVYNRKGKKHHVTS